MNTEPKAQRILCFGDSNTHGRDAKAKAQDGVKTRLPVGVRWTSVLQAKLGSSFEIIEEGLGGRTTDLDDPDSDRNGFTYFKPCLASHVPVDVVVLMLGTNDFKDRFNRSPEQVASALEKYIDYITSVDEKITILLVSPIHIDGSHPMAVANYREATDKSHQLTEHLEKLAQAKQCYFLDLAQHVQPSEYDGLHIGEEDQEVVAGLVFKKINELAI